MKRIEQLKLIHEQLIRKRDEIYTAHSRTEEDRRALIEPDIEFEETAQKESIEDVLAQLDEQERLEIEAIDRALEKARLGKYGLCEVCGKPIAVKRLAALPWTPLCAIHANQGP